MADRRPVWLVRLDKVRPAVLLTRASVAAGWPNVTVAPISSTRWGLRSEVVVGPDVGIDHDSVIQCDAVLTVGRDRLLRQVGALDDRHERALRTALLHAYDLPTDGDDGWDG